MLKSRTRRRVAAKTAVIAAAGAGILFGAFPAIASIYAAPKPVTYECRVAGAAAGATQTLQMDLTGPTAAVTKAPITATWKIVPPTPIVAPSAITLPLPLVLDADIQINSTPAGVLAVPSELRSIAATVPAATMSASQTITLPPLVATVTPNATGVVAFQPDAFSVYLEGGTAVGATDLELLDCNIPVNAQASAEASAAALRVTVGTGSPSASPSPSASASVSPSASVTPPKPTVTISKTVTSDPEEPSDEQIDETPDGGASTGGGGDAGPDARMIMLSGALVVAVAGVGGLVLRRRTAGRG